VRPQRVFLAPFIFLLFLSLLSPNQEVEGAGGPGPLVIITSTLPGSSIALSGEGSTLYEHVHIYIIAENGTEYQVQINSVLVVQGIINGTHEKVDTVLNGSQADIVIVVGNTTWTRTYTVIHQTYTGGGEAPPRGDLIQVSKYYISQLKWETALKVMWGVVLSILVSYPALKLVRMVKGPIKVYPQ